MMVNRSKLVLDISMKSIRAMPHDKNSEKKSKMTFLLQGELVMQEDTEA